MTVLHLIQLVRAANYCRWCQWWLWNAEKMTAVTNCLYIDVTDYKLW